MYLRSTLVAMGLLLASSVCAIPLQLLTESLHPATETPRTVPDIEVSAEITQQTTPVSTDETTQPCNPGKRIIALIVDPLLEADIRAGLRQFEFDLCQEGYSVVMSSSQFTTASEVRTFLVDLYQDSGSMLVGAILVGAIPHAYQWLMVEFGNPDIPALEEEVISFQYYADLDGIFEQSPGYSSPGGHLESFDVHVGDVDWELWIGVLPLYKGDYAQTAAAVNWYFAKNHDYRSGASLIPRGYMYISEHFTANNMSEHEQIMSEFRDGPYAWTPFSLDPGAQFYFDSPSAGVSVDDGYDNLQAGVADFVVADAHGYWGGHGKIDIAWVESHHLRTVFFWSNGCAVGNLDHAENFLSSVLYSPLSMVLVAKGTTNNSGGLGTNSEGFFGHNIATAMDAGASFGEAVVGHVNVPLISPWDGYREFHFATPVFLGDPTLRLVP